MPQPFGLIAGEGELPLEIARAARAGGRRIHAIGLRGLSRPELAADVDEICWLALGALGALLESLRGAGVRDVVMAGKVDKAHLYDGSLELRPDQRALELLARLPDRRDDSILCALAQLLEQEGFALQPQAGLVPHLFAEEGCLGKTRPSEEQLRDVEFGWPIAKLVAAADIGQCVVVKQRAVMAIEAIEGTDAAVRRGGRLGGEGACVIKLARPGQDPRFDLPAVGPDTLDALIEVGAGALAVEAGSSLVLQRERMIERADAHGIALLGVSADGVVRALRELS